LGGGLDKFAEFDEKIISARDKFFADASDLTPRFAIDNWPLIAGAVPIAIWAARYELVKMVVNVPGHIMEFGVFNGSNLLFMAKLLTVLAPGDLRLLYGFDSWKGLTEFAGADGNAAQYRGAYNGRRDVLEQMITLHRLQDRVRLIDGLIETTLPSFLEENKHHPYSLIYLDTDLYKPTKLVLELCWDRVPPGGMIAFDEGYHDRYPGEGAAVQEFLPKVAGQYEAGHFVFARQPMLWIRKK
jgi:hypothetical protein